MNMHNNKSFKLHKIREMFNSHKKHIFYLTGVFAAILITSCSSEQKTDQPSNYERLMSSDSIPQSIKNIVKAVNDNNPSEFAKMVDYPLERPYPLKDIRNKEEMIAYYNTIMDDSLRNVILNSTPEDWEEYGWRGYSVGDGSYLWVDETIYAMDYLSEKEKNVLDSLNKIEKNSLPKQIRNGWTPVITLLSKETGKIYRIDMFTSVNAEEGHKYRLSIYEDNKDRNSLLNMPDRILNGNIEVEGSANVICYSFHEKDGTEYDIYPDYPSTGTPYIIMPDGSESELSKVYWHELIRH